jgi:hypothetical protein
MLARFRKKNRKRFRQMGGSFDIPQHKQSAGSEEALAQHNADQERAADNQIAANKVGGGRRRRRTRRRQVGGEKFTVPQDRNAGADGNASMRKSSEMLAQSQADQSHDASGGGRRRRRTRRTRRKRKRKTKRRKKHYKKRKTKRYRKRR